MRSGLPVDAMGRLERVAAAVSVPGPVGGYESDVYAWSDAQELYRMLTDWAVRVSSNDDRSSVDEQTLQRIHQLLGMPGVADLLGPATTDAHVLAEQLFGALHVDRPRFAGESPEIAHMRNTVWLGVLVPFIALLIGGFGVRDLTQRTSGAGIAALVVALSLCAVTVRFWTVRFTRRARSS